jgi:hypothetical protein
VLSKQIQHVNVLKKIMQLIQYCKSLYNFAASINILGVIHNKRQTNNACPTTDTIDKYDLSFKLIKDLLANKPSQKFDSKCVHFIKKRNETINTINMRMKMKSKLKLSTIAFTAGTILLVGCTSEDNAYVNNLQEQAKINFPVQNIDSKQTWNLLGTTTINTTVNENYGETYTIKVYSSDPIGNSSAQLLSESNVISGSSVKQTFEYGIGDSTLYVSRVDSKSRREVLPVQVSNGGTSSVTFSNSTNSSSTAKSKAMRKTPGDFSDPAIAAKRDAPYTESQIADFCNSNAIEITEGMDVAFWQVRDKNYETFYISGNINSFTNLTSGDFRGKRIIVKDGGVWNVSGSEGAVQQGVEVIVAKGGKINLNGNTLTSQNSTGYSFIVMPGGEISGTGSSNLSVNVGNGSIYNGGTVDTPSLSFSSGGFVYNAGTMTFSNDVLLNTGANFINYGTATFNGTITVPASGYLYNASGATLYGKLLKFNTSATLINHGSSCHFVDTQNDNDNANYETTCKLIIDNNFRPSNVVISNGGSIQCKNMLLHNSTITMGNASILKAETTTIESFTFTAPTTGNYAICALGDISSASGYGNCSFTGNIYVDITSNPWASEANKYQFWQQATNKYANGAKEVGENEAGITIETSDCSIGYTYTNKGGDGIDKAAVCTYGFEDMTTIAGDYDFNDVVLKVSKKDETHYTVVLAAVGATKKLAVHFNNGTSDVVVFDNVHTALGVDVGTMVNTGNDTKTVATVSKDVDVPSGFSLSKDGDFYLVDLSNNIPVHIPAFTSGFKTGDVPYGLRVPTDWAYPTERTKVTESYTGFAAWAQDITKNIGWYSTPVTSKVFIKK